MRSGDGFGPRRSRRRGGTVISAVVAATVVLLVGLAVWVAAGSDTPTARLGEHDVACDAAIRPEHPDADVREWRRACADAESERTIRRDRAIVIGAIGVIIAGAFSTWPSRRLTGEHLGPAPEDPS